jgi:hypothetical protein
MPTQTDQIVALLSSIDRSLKRMAAKTVEPAVAPVTDLDGKFGDPEVRFMPRDWSGDNYKGMKFSACPPDLLDLLANALDWSAQKAEDNNETTTTGKPLAPFKRMDAARARGWAKRKREGWRPTDSHPADPLLDSDDPDVDPFGGPDDDIPF